MPWDWVIFKSCMRQTEAFCDKLHIRSLDKVLWGGDCSGEVPAPGAGVRVWNVLRISQKYSNYFG